MTARDASCSCACRMSASCTAVRVARSPRSRGEVHMPRYRGRGRHAIGEHVPQVEPDHGVRLVHELDWIDARRLATRDTDEHEAAERAQRCERSTTGRAADAIEDDIERWS